MKCLNKFDIAHCVSSGRGTQYICNKFMQFILSICELYFFSWEGEYWICLFWGKEKRDWLECIVLVSYVCHMLLLICRYFFTCVINILEIYLPFPLSYTRKTVIAMSLHHSDSTSLAVKLSWLLKSLMIIRKLLMERKCVASHAWVNLHSERRSLFVPL